MNNTFIEDAIRPLLDQGDLFVCSKTADAAWDQVRVSTPEELTAAIEARLDLDLYVTTAAFERGQPRKAEFVTRRGFISLDIDDKAMPGSSAEEKHAMAHAVAELVPGYRWTIDSGGGYQVHLPLDAVHKRLNEEGDDLTARDAEGYALRLRRFIQREAVRVLGVNIRLDNCDGSERVWRVPGSVNRKLEGEPRPVRLVLMPSGPYFPDLTFLDRASARVKLAHGYEGFSDVHVSQEVHEAMKTCFEGKWPMAAGDQSAHDYQLARYGFELGLEPEEIKGLIRLRRAELESAVHRQKAHREDYLQRTVDAARAAPPATEDRNEPDCILPFIGCHELETEIEEERHLVKGMIPAKSIALIVSLPKDGKTHMTCGLLSAMEQGVPFAGFPTEVCRAVVLSEEALSSLREKQLKFALRDTRFASIRNTGGVSFEVAVKAAVEEALRIDAELLVIDTLSAWGGMSGDAENSAGSAARIMEPLLAATGQGLTVLVLHHTRKGEGNVIEAVRGSTAIAASVDTIIHLSARSDGRRRLRIVGRSDHLEPEIWLRADGAEYQRIEGPPEVPEDRIQEQIFELLKAGGRTRAELSRLVKGKSRAIAQVTDRLVKSGAVHRSGLGMKGDPHVFSLPVESPIPASHP